MQTVHTISGPAEEETGTVPVPLIVMTRRAGITVPASGYVNSDGRTARRRLGTGKASRVGLKHGRTYYYYVSRVAVQGPVSRVAIRIDVRIHIRIRIHIHIRICIRIRTHIRCVCVAAAGRVSTREGLKRRADTARRHLSCPSVSARFRVLDLRCELCQQ